MPPLRPDAGRKEPDWRLAAFTLARHLGIFEASRRLQPTSMKALTGIDDPDLDDAYDRGRIAALAQP